MEIEHSSNTETLVHVTLDTGAKTTTTILEGVNDGLLLQGTSGGDDITVIWVETANDGAGSSGAGFSVEIDGGDGHDTVKLMAGSASDLGLGLLGTLLDPVLNLSGDTLADVLSDGGTLSGGTWDLQALTVRAEDITLLGNTRVEAIDDIVFEAHANAADQSPWNSAITVAGGVVSSAGGVVLDALADWTFSGAAPTVSFVQSAAVEVLSDVFAFADIDISAVTQAALTFAESTQEFVGLPIAPPEILIPAGSAQNAGIVIGQDADLQGSKISLLSEADLNLSAEAAASTADATVSVDIDQIANTTLASGANVTASSTATDALVIDALVETGVDVVITSGDLSLFDVIRLGSLSAVVDLVRHADVQIGDTAGLTAVNLAVEDYSNTARWSAVDLPAETFLSSDGAQDLVIGDVVHVANGHGAGGDVGATYVFLGDAQTTTLEAAGGAAVNARLVDHSSRPVDRGVNVDIQSSIFGEGTVTLDDRAAVRGQNLQILADSLDAIAAVENSQTVEAQFASISSTGLVSSDLAGLVFGAPGGGGQTGLLRVAATDAGVFRTESSEFVRDPKEGMATKIEAFGAINALARSVDARVSGGAISADRIEVSAQAVQLIDARVDAQALVEQPDLLGTMALGGSYAINHISGGVTALLTNVAITSDVLSTTSSVDVVAESAMTINARAEAGTKATGGITDAKAVGGVVALNIIGAETAPTDRVAVDHTVSSTPVSLQPRDVIETEDGELYRFIGRVGEASVNLSLENLDDTDRWQRIYRRDIDDFLLLESSEDGAVFETLPRPRVF